MIIIEIIFQITFNFRCQISISEIEILIIDLILAIVLRLFSLTLVKFGDNNLLEINIFIRLINLYFELKKILCIFTKNYQFKQRITKILVTYQNINEICMNSLNV